MNIPETYPKSFQTASESTHIPTFLREDHVARMNTLKTYIKSFQTDLNPIYAPTFLRKDQVARMYISEIEWQILPRMINSGFPEVWHPYNFMDLHPYNFMDLLSSNESAQTMNPKSLPPDLEGEIVQFSKGLGSEKPSENIVRIVRRCAISAMTYTRQPEMGTDVDGAFSFDLRLRDGRLVMAEISIDGKVDFSVYDCPDGRDVHNPSATGEDLQALIES